MPPQSYSHGDVGWVIAANLAAALAAWARLLGYRCDEELRNADPETLRYWAFGACPRSSPATPVSGSLISPDWPLEGCLSHLLAPAPHALHTRLTSTSHLSDKE
jgi:hypothetical protein